MSSISTNTSGKPRVLDIRKRFEAWGSCSPRDALWRMRERVDLKSLGKPLYLFGALDPKGDAILVGDMSHWLGNVDEFTDPFTGRFGLEPTFNCYPARDSRIPE